MSHFARWSLVPFLALLPIASTSAQAERQNPQPARVRFAFDNADVRKIVNAIARISGTNIIVPKEMTGKVTLRLQDVPWRAALDQAVAAVGYKVMEEKRGILRIVPKAAPLPAVVETFGFRNIRPSAAAVKQLTELLTKTGRLEFISRKNIIHVKDTTAVVSKIRARVAQMDVAPWTLQDRAKELRKGLEFLGEARLTDTKAAATLEAALEELQAAIDAYRKRREATKR